MIIAGKRATLLVIALCISVAINLFVAGFVVRKMVHWGDQPHFVHLVERYAGAFPPELHKRLRHELGEQREELRYNWRQLRQTRQQMNQIMRTDPLDFTAFDNAATEMRAHMEQIQRIAHSAIRNTLVDADPDLRAKIRPRHVHRWRRDHTQNEEQGDSSRSEPGNTDGSTDHDG